MTDVTAQEFLEILKDPAMADAKERIIQVVKNPKTQVINIEVSSYNPASTTMTIRLKI